MIGRQTMLRGAYVLSLALIQVSSLRAQTAELHPGIRARVTLEHEGARVRTTGEVLRFTSDSLVFRADGASLAWHIPVIHRLEVSRGRHPNGFKGMLIGAAATASLGLLMASGLPGCRIDCVAFVGGVGAVPGAFVGAFVGLQIKTERWKTVQIVKSGLSF